MNRRGFLGAILAAGVAPAIARAGILMPVRQIVVPRPLYTGEIGEIDCGYAFIESAGPGLHSTMAYANGPPPVLTVEMMRRATRKLMENAAKPPFFALVHPSWAADLRAEGIPVAPQGWRPIK